MTRRFSAGRKRVATILSSSSDSDLDASAGSQGLGSAQGEQHGQVELVCLGWSEQGFGELVWAQANSCRGWVTHGQGQRPWAPMGSAGETGRGGGGGIEFMICLGLGQAWAVQVSKVCGEGCLGLINVWTFDRIK